MTSEAAARGRERSGEPAWTGEPGDTSTLLGRPAVGYLDAAADTLATVKREILRRLAPAPGQRILDVGCGNGTDVLELAGRVVPSGEAVGVDVNERAIEEARARGTGTGVPASFMTAGAYALPFPDGRFDGVRAERVVQHLADPAGAIAEMARVTRPGGRVLVADPDHGMWAPDLDDREAARTVLTWWFDNIRNPWIGRRLSGLLRAAGLVEVQARLMPVVLDGIAAADGLTGFSDAVRRAGELGVLAPERARALTGNIVEREADGGFLMYGAMILAEGRKGG
ncbi:MULTISPECIES: methyltransferase domain-containing protein [Thermomonosporaceae]|uniref:methyltransferase domain-containing protein n=1 Tax=Thermomonosporaceae TaxID=2012 RepID=UPI00255AE288|nr:MULTISPECIES: methyltransferase domain-containing protein [Thermomonosporaceae]MDL4774103.1 methyltransferase domain-containing protein [Actinomadura xylanilytica]